MSYQYVDPYGNPYVRGWGNDFTEEERSEREIGEFNWNSSNYTGPPRGGSLKVDPSRITQGKFQMPGLGNRIEDFLGTLPKAPGSPGERRIPYYDDNWNAGGSGRTKPEDWIMDGPAPGRGYADVQPDPTFTGEDWLNQQLPSKPPRPEGMQRVATGIADWITGNKWDLDQRGGSGIPRGRGQYYPRVLATTMMGRHPDGTPVTFDNPHGKVDGTEVTNTDGTPLTPPMQTPPADVPTPPLEKTLEQRVWERGQMPNRTPDAQGRLYPDKNDPGFLDPRVQGDGRMTMQYIPELDDPNWTPWKNYGPGWSREQDWNKGGEGVQYRM